MKKKLYFLGLCLLTITACGYNPLVEFDERADKHWYQIEDVYNRQSDLVPLLIKQYKNANPADIAALNKAREAVANLSIAKEDIEINTIKKYIEQQKNFTQPLDEILNDIYAEIKNLPATDPQRAELKTLTAQIIGSHNRVAVACEKYNKVVEEYNTYQGGLTQKMTANLMGFHHKEKLDMQIFERKFPNFDSLDSQQ